jgi:hypothetical protein
MGGRMSTKRHLATVGVLTTIFLCWSGVYLYTASQRELANATNMTCSFPIITTGTWTDGEPEAELGISTLSFQFVEIDTDAATANAIGPFGPGHIIARFSGEYLHFMQLFNKGPLYVTTVIDRKTNDGKFMAVHTRHEYIDIRLVGFTSRPEQYYGECAIHE